MMTKRQLMWNYLFLIITVLPCCWSVQVSIEQKEYEVTSGGDATLTCSFVPAQSQITNLLLKWDVDPVSPDDPLKPVATYFLNSPVNIAPAYEGRATLEIDLNQHVSKLHLKQVTVSDSRRYQCSVVIFDDDEGTTAASTSLLVLVPPSVPLCKLQGRAEYWQDISLTCVSEDGSPKPTYEWKSYSVENMPRTFPPKTTQKDGVLSLFNISRETSGFFVCTSTNRIGTNHCNYTLAVMPGGVNEANMAAIIGGVIAGVVVLGIIIFICRRRKNKKAKYAEGAAEEMEYEKDAPEVEEQFGDDKSQGKTRQLKQNEYKDSPKSGHRLDDDQQSNSSSKDRAGGKGSETNSQHYRDDQRDQYRRSRDHLDEQRDRYGGSRDRLDEQSERYHGNRVEEKPNHYGGSRDRLDDQRDNYRSSRDRLDDHRDNYRGSRDRLDDQRDYRGSRDRLDDQSDRYYRDRYDDQRDRYRGSRDRLDYRDDEYRD